jgi:hypothetical protein
MHLVGMILLNLSTLLFLVSGASAVIRFEPPPSNASVLEGGTATFTCVPKEDRSSPIALWNIHLVRNINETIFVGPGNTTNLTGSSGVILSPNRTQLRITGIQRRLDGIGVECRGSSNSGLFPAPLVYISVQRPPNFTLPVSSEERIEGQSLIVTLERVDLGNAEGDLSVMFQESVFTEGSGFSVARSDNIWNITFPVVYRNSTGLYKVVLRTSLGSVAANFTLNVICEFDLRNREIE